MNRLRNVKESVEIALADSNRTYALARLIFDAESGLSNFLTRDEIRESRIVRRLGHMTNASQLVAWDYLPGIQNRYVLTDRIGGGIDLTITDELPGGAVTHYRVGESTCRDTTREAILESPFFNRMLEIVMAQPEFQALAGRQEDLATVELG